MSPARLRLAALAGAIAVLLAGCVSLPQSGPVQEGDPDVAAPGSIALLARLPGPDDTPREIVDGFLRAAAAGLTDGFTIAREFLTSPAQSQWDPLARVSVYAGQPAVVNSGEAQDVDVTAEVLATVDEEGRYTEALPGVTVRVDLQLAQDTQGRWRIREVEDGVLLSEPIFRSLFQQVPLYFVAPDGEALVSETRWYPRRTVETSAVISLLQGPSPWLEEGATSRFPPGTRLLVDTVTVRDGVAQVGLSGEAREASPEDRGLMLAQLNETLTGLPRVQSVAVSAAAAAFDVSTARRDLVVDPSVGTSPVVLHDGFLRAVEGSELVPWGETGPVTAPLPSHPAVPYDTGAPVVLSRGSSVVTVATDGEPSRTLLSGADMLTPPSYDRLGWIWTSPASSKGSVHVVRADGTTAVAAADWLASREVLSLRLSRDGARALVLSVAGTTVTLEVAAVVRSAEGTPVSLGRPLRIGQPISRASTAIWVDHQTIAVLGRVSESSTDTVVLTVVGGPTSALPAVDGAVGLAAGKGDRLLFVSTAAGELLSRNGLGWTPTARDVLDPAFPG